VPNLEGGSLAQSFRDAGYATAYVGKWHLGDPSSKGPVAEHERGGYERWLAANSLEHTSEPYSTTLWDEHGEPVSLPGYRVDAVADAAIRMLASADGRPFLLFVSFLEPHQQNRVDDYPAPAGHDKDFVDPWTPPDLASLGGNSAEKLPGYYAMVKRLDDALGRVTDALKSLGQDSSTVVAFSSDHGCHFKTRNWEYKRSVHDASIRVPFVMSGPGLPEGRVVTEVVSTLDMTSTLLDLAEIEIPQAFHSRSLLPLIWYRAPGDDEAFFQISESEIARGIRTRSWKYAVVAEGADPLIDAHATAYREAYLYDLEHDPWELRNLVGLASHREVADRLRMKLDGWIARASETPIEIQTVEREPELHSQLRVVSAEVPD
jgi:arylsulfatase A-like enzyme